MKKHVFLLSQVEIPQSLSKQIDSISPQPIKSLEDLPIDQNSILLIYQNVPYPNQKDQLAYLKAINPNIKIVLLIDCPKRDLFRNYLAAKIDYPIHIYNKHQNFISNFKFILAESKEQFPNLTSRSIVLNPNNQTVKLNSHPLKLRKKEYELLKYLLLKKGTIATKTELLEKVWHYRYDVFTKTVDTHIHHLKRKLNKEKSVIQTIYGQGYQLSPDEIPKVLLVQPS